jgi:hypothetical protein
MAQTPNDRKRLEELAAIVSGVMVGAAGYRSGRLIDPKETVEDALEIAREIIMQIRSSDGRAY